VIDKLNDREQYPEAKEDEELPSYSRGILRWLEDDIWFPISRRINWLLDRVKDNTLEIIKEGSVAGDDGNWRFFIDGDDLKTQRRESGTWVSKGTFQADGT